MPTGYTAPIEKGITFKEYAMGCARAFGSLIMMREDPQSAEIPEKFEPSPYYKDEIENESKQLKELLAMDDATATKKAKDAHQEKIEYHTAAIAKNEDLLAKYKSMLTEVEAYESPSPEHDEFKKFMAQQIKESIKFDCGSTYHEEGIQSAKLMSGTEWKAEEARRLNESITRHKKYYQEELDRTNSRNEWLRKLRESLQA